MGGCSGLRGSVHRGRSAFQVGTYKQQLGTVTQRLTEAEVKTPAMPLLSARVCDPTLTLATCA